MENMFTKHNKKVKKQLKDGKHKNFTPRFVNKNAGDVEANIARFNKMSKVGEPSIDHNVSTPDGMIGAVSSAGGIGEALDDNGRFDLVDSLYKVVKPRVLHAIKKGATKDDIEQALEEVVYHLVNDEEVKM